MKRKLKYGLIPALLITAFSAITASAKNIATAVLDKAADSNHVTVALDFSETKTEIITTLRFKLLVAVEEGELAEDDVSFTFAEIPGDVKDAKITYDADVTDYVVDIIVSGKENIFRDAVGVPLTIGTLNLPDGDDYSAEVGLVAYDDGGEEKGTDDSSDMVLDVIEEDKEENLIDTVSVLEYVENAGLEPMKVQMKTDKQVSVGKESEQPQTEPSQTEPSQTETESQQTVTEAAAVPASFSKHAKPQLTVIPVAGTSKLKFSWEKLSGASGYDIAKYDKKTKKYQKIATVKKGNSYTAKFDFGKRYKFKIRAYKKTKKGKYKYSLFSDVVTVKTSVFDKKKKTTLRVKGRVDNRKITLKWASVKGADGYKLYQYNSATGSYEELATVEGMKKASYAVAGSYKSARSYKFMVRPFARNDKGKEVLGAASVCSYKTYPGQVTGLSAEVQKSAKVKLSWKRVRRAEGYFVFRSRSGESGSFRKIAQIKGGKSLSYVDSEAESGERYHYAVRAYISDKSGAYRRGAPSDVVIVDVS